MTHRTLMLALVAVVGAALAPAVHALEVTPGDYEIFPPNVNIGLLYLQHAKRSDLYTGGQKVSSNFRLSSDIGLARYIRTVPLSATTSVDINVILPFGRLKASGEAAALGSASGSADLIVGAATRFLLDPQTRDAFSVGTFVYLPTGQYDANKPLNLGENRWKGLLQLAWVGHFGSRWVVDAVGDVQVAGANDESGPTRARLTQAARWELQSHLRYNLSPATALAVGAGHVWGAETKIGGVAQNDRQKTTWARLSLNHWLSPTLQLQAQLGKDLKVESGLKESTRLNLRAAMVF
jgi:hypothetical protein